MTANFLTLNSAKTEFLPVGLQQQFAKINTCSLVITDSAHNPGLMNTLLSLSKSLAIIVFVNFVVFVVILTLKLPVPSPLLSTLVHSKTDHCNSVYYNLPQFSIVFLFFFQNSLIPAVTNKPKSSHVTPVLKSLHWLRINKPIKYKPI